MKDGPVLGVHLLGDRVGELITEGQLAVGWEAHPEDIAPFDPRAPDAERSARRGLPRPGRQAAARALTLAARRGITKLDPISHSEGDIRHEHIRGPPRSRRERDRGNGHPLAQAGRRHRPGGRGPARDLHRQGRHRDPVAGQRRASRRSSSRRTRPSRSAPSSRRSATAAARPIGCRARGRAAGRGRSRRAAAPAAEAPAPAVEEPAPAAEPAPATPRPRPRPSRPRRRGDGKDVVLPELGESVTEGTVTRWLKQVGDDGRRRRAAARDLHRQGRHRDPLPRSPACSRRSWSSEDETVAVGAVLARIGDAGAAPAPRRGARRRRRPRPQPKLRLRPLQPAPAAARARRAGSRRPAPQPAPGCPRPRLRPPRRLPPPLRADARSARPTRRTTTASPTSRRSCAASLQQQGVDLASVKGTGVGGRIRKEDVLKAAEAAVRSGRAGRPRRRVPHRSRCRRCAARRSRCRGCARCSPSAPSSRCSRPPSSPRVVEVDVTKLATFRDKVKNDFLAKTGDKLSFLPFFALAAAEALQAYPIVNATVDGDRHRLPGEREPVDRGRHRARPADARRCAMRRRRTSPRSPTRSPTSRLARATTS